jgi:hypothetical protein
MDRLSVNATLDRGLLHISIVPSVYCSSSATSPITVFCKLIGEFVKFVEVQIVLMVFRLAAEAERKRTRRPALFNSRVKEVT